MLSQVNTCLPVPYSWQILARFTIELSSVNKSFYLNVMENSHDHPNGTKINISAGQHGIRYGSKSRNFIHYID